MMEKTRTKYKKKRLTPRAFLQSDILMNTTKMVTKERLEKSSAKKRKRKKKNSGNFDPKLLAKKRRTSSRNKNMIKLNGSGGQRLNCMNHPSIPAKFRIAKKTIKPLIYDNREYYCLSCSLNLALSGLKLIKVSPPAGNKFSKEPRSSSRQIPGKFDYSSWKKKGSTMFEEAFKNSPILKKFLKDEKERNNSKKDLKFYKIGNSSDDLRITKDVMESLAALRMDAANLKAILSNEMFRLKQNGNKEKRLILTIYDGLINSLVQQRDIFTDRVEQEGQDLIKELSECMKKMEVNIYVLDKMFESMNTGTILNKVESDGLNNVMQKMEIPISKKPKKLTVSEFDIEKTGDLIEDILSTLSGKLHFQIFEQDNEVLLEYNKKLEVIREGVFSKFGASMVQSRFQSDKKMNIRNFKNALRNNLSISKAKKMTQNFSFNTSRLQDASKKSRTLSPRFKSGIKMKSTGTGIMHTIPKFEKSLNNSKNIGHVYTKETIKKKGIGSFSSKSNNKISFSNIKFPHKHHKTIDCTSTTSKIKFFNSPLKQLKFSSRKKNHSINPNKENMRANENSALAVDELQCFEKLNFPGISAQVRLQNSQKEEEKTKIIETIEINEFDDDRNEESVQMGDDDGEFDLECCEDMPPPSFLFGEGRKDNGFDSFRV